jgi:hypothetical protein
MLKPVGQLILGCIDRPSRRIRHVSQVVRPHLLDIKIR